MAKKKIAPIYFIALIVLITIFAVLFIRYSPSFGGNALVSKNETETINMTITDEMSPADAVNKLLNISAEENSLDSDTTSLTDSDSINSDSVIEPKPPEVSESLDVVNTEENITVVDLPAVKIDGVQQISEDALQEMIKKVNFSNQTVPLNIIFVDEGDFVSFPNVRAADPDSDNLEISFGPPLNLNGEWQTKKGDAGRYNVSVVVSDGKEKSNESIIIVVERTNFPPVITMADTLYYKEGDIVVLSPVVYDEENDTVSVSYSGFMNASTLELDYNTAGIQTVKIRADDGNTKTIKTVTLDIANVNRKPRIDIPSELQYVEGDFIDLKPRVIDPDNDAIAITYGGWMNSSAKQTTRGDAGSYKVLITVNDGSSTVTKEVSILVTEKNRAPFISIQNSIEFIEGEMGELRPVITDPDNDPVTVTYSGWMDSPRKQISYNDAGVHEVLITASDTKDESSKSVTITVIDKNRAPKIGIDSVVTFTEGQTAILDPQGTDDDGDTVSFSYSGWMQQNSKVIADGEAGNHSVTITATDGKSVVTKVITVVVIDRNRPPVISMPDVLDFNEGDTITLQPKITDLDNDDITVSYSGWMTSNIKKLGYADAGIYQVTITASDGIEKTQKMVTINVKNKNRPPFFVNIL